MQGTTASSPNPPTLGTDDEPPPTLGPEPPPDERLGGFIYGTIVVLSVLVVGAKAYPHDALHIEVLVLGTTLVFWLAHVYAHTLGHAVAHGTPFTLSGFRRTARHEASIIEAGVPSLLALLLGVFGIVSTSAAVWSAFGLGLAVLIAQGLAYARAQRLGIGGTLMICAANIAFGLLLVALKIGVTH